MSREFGIQNADLAHPKFNMDVLLIDDNTGLLLWEAVSTPAGGHVEQSASYAFEGSKSLLLHTDTDTPAQGDSIYAYRLFDCPPGGVITARVRFKPKDDTAIQYLNVWLDLNDGAQIYRALLQYAPNASEVKYRDSAGADQAFSDGLAVLGAIGWYTATIVADMTTHTWVAARMAGFEAPVAGLPLQNTAATNVRYAKMGLQVTAQGAASATAYFDDAIVIAGRR